MNLIKAFIKERKLFSYTLLIIIILAPVYFIITSVASNNKDYVYIQVERGEFESLVVTTGELESGNQMKIMAPTRELREFQINEILIASLITEGTYVDSGQVIAKLDQSSVNNAIKDNKDKMDSYNEELDKMLFDTLVQLQQIRDNIVNIKFDLEQLKLALEQSKYESPAVIKQAELSLDKQQRAYAQAIRNCKLKKKQFEIGISKKKNQLNRFIERKDKMQELLNKLIIKAPSSGMITYAKDRNGDKIKPGSQISLWRNPVIGYFPDISNMYSLTYVNEIDISKVKKGLQVKIFVDALPNNEFIGEVISVANISEQKFDNNVKVFEVRIKIKDPHQDMRPGMTSSNKIISENYSNVLFVPIDVVYYIDAQSYVYVLSGGNILKRSVELSSFNENYIIINSGLEENEKVLLSTPENLSIVQ